MPAQFPSPRGYSGFVLNSILITRLQHLYVESERSWAFTFQLPIYLCGKLYTFTEELLEVIQRSVGEMTGTKKQICALLGILFFGILAPLRVHQWQKKKCKGFACVVTDVKSGVSSFLPLVFQPLRMIWKTRRIYSCSTGSCESLLLSCVGKVALSFRWLQPFHIRNGVGG